MSLKYEGAELAAIDEIASAYGLSHNHLTKIVHEMSVHSVITTTRGSAGGKGLARPPGSITVGEIFRWSEPDFPLVECLNRAIKNE